MPVSMQANRVNDEINRDHQLTKHRNLEAVNPATEPIHNHCQCSEFEQRRDAFTKKSFDLAAALRIRGFCGR